MQPIHGFDSVQAIHGRQGALPGGPYVVVIMRAKEDVTGYGNPCLKVVYDILEGPFAGRFADINADTDQDWRHEVEIDTAEANGARLKALTDAIAASNPGWVWDWNEQNMANRVFGLVLQERKVTRTKGKNKGKDATYLDFWDAVPADAVRAGQVPTPPVNDRRTSQPQQAPVPVPASYGQQQAPVAAPVAPQAAPQAPVAQPAYQQQAQTYQQAPAPQYVPQTYQQAPAPQYVPQTYQQAPAPQYVPQTYQQAPTMPMADDDIPF